jgi:electron transfer flavoprotein beta subunit
MEIIVCVKRVAATDSRIKVAADGRSIDPSGVEFDINPYDVFAVEEALKTKEALGAGSVTVVTLGSSAAQKELRTCLAMGADKAVVLDVGDARLDAYATAATMAKYLESVPHDLIFCGKQAVDGDESQFPQRLAALLDMACVTEVAKLSLDGTTFTAERDIEGAREVVECPSPAVISTNKGLNEPRLASLKGIMAAKKKPLETVAVEPVASATETASFELPPERPPGKVVESVDELIAALKNEAKVL